MQQSPSWEAASQEIPRILWNPKVHYRTHKCPPPLPVLSQIDPVPTSWRSILILYSYLRLGLPSGLFPSRLPTKNPCTPLPYPIRATCHAHLILLDFTTCTIFRKEYRTLSSSLCNFLHSPDTSSLLRPNIFSSIMNYKVNIGFKNPRQVRWAAVVKVEE
jgi:hypothetical protein